MEASVLLLQLTERTAYHPESRLKDFGIVNTGADSDARDAVWVHLRNLVRPLMSRCLDLAVSTSPDEPCREMVDQGISIPPLLYATLGDRFVRSKYPINPSVDFPILPDPRSESIVKAISRFRKRSH